MKHCKEYLGQSNRQGYLLQLCIRFSFILFELVVNIFGKHWQVIANLFIE